MSTEDRPKKRGRPFALICDEPTLKMIEGLAKIQCTQAEAAGVLGVIRETFHNFLNANPDAREVWDAGLESGKASLRRNLFKLSETNTAAAIWLSKQYLGMREPLNQEYGKKEQAQLTAATAGQGSDWSGDLEFDGERPN